MTRLATVLATLATLAGCAQDPGGPQPLAVVGAEQAALPGVRPRGVYVVVPPHPEVVPRAPGHRVVFMNRMGGTFTPGYDNSSTNSSSIPSSTSHVSAWSYGDTKWNQLMTCVRTQFEPFDIEVTDVDPGSVPHVESVVGGTPGEVQMPQYVGGVSPFTYDCSMIERSIVYTFSGVYGGDVQSICETVAQETAHSYGLDHELYCPDPMTYLGGCGAKSFRDHDAQCGEDSPRACACGASTQNSYQWMMARIGAGNQDDIAPNISFTQPAAGATVMAGFGVVADASDNVGVVKVDLYVDGANLATDSAAPFEFTTPASLAPGAHNLEVRAFDAQGNMKSATRSVTVQEAGTDPPPDPPPPPPPDPGALGSPCASGDDCTSGLCANQTFCTQTCSSGDPGSCGSGFDCVVAATGDYCVPQDLGGGGGGGNELIGGCAVAGRGTPGAAVLALFFAIGLLYLRTRRRTF
jgi:hypothetical protein